MLSAEPLGPESGVPEGTAADEGLQPGSGRRLHPTLVVRTDAG